MFPALFFDSPSGKLPDLRRSTPTRGDVAAYASCLCLEEELVLCELLKTCKSTRLKGVRLNWGSAPRGDEKILSYQIFRARLADVSDADHHLRPIGRNALRGFGATQSDLTVRRQFRFTERFSLQFRGDFFNILNHPNFGRPINYMSSSQFDYATQMLNNYLGAGDQSAGLNPLYQIGGPRSIQLALKLQF